MRFSDFIIFPNQSEYIILIFHNILIDWLLKLQRIKCSIGDIDDIELIPSSNKNWTFNFKKDNMNQYYFTIMPPYWTLNIKYKYEYKMYKECPNIIYHQWENMIKSFIKKMSLIRLKDDKLLLKFYIILKQIDLENEMKCPYCIFHKTQIPNEYKMLYPYRLIKPYVIDKELIDYLKENIRRENLQNRVIETIMEIIGESWNKILNNIENTNEIKDKCIKEIQTYLIKEIPFLKLNKNVNKYVLSIFNMYNEIEEWNNYEKSNTIGKISKMTYIISLLFYKIFLYDEIKMKGYIKEDENESILLNDKMEMNDRLKDTHPLLMGHYYEMSKN